jgi:hypothetical protein
MVDMEAATMVKAPGTELTLIRSHTPAIYVPRRLRIGGLPGIEHGAAIVGTPQDSNMVAIDVEWTQYVDPTPEVWGNWIAAAAQRHLSAEEDLEATEDENRTRLVSAHDLIEIGRYERGCVLIDSAGRQKLQAWIQAGRTAAFLAESPSELHA